MNFLNSLSLLLLKVLLRFAPGMKCPLHKSSFQVGSAMSQAGLLRKSEGFKAASRSLFPCAHSELKSIYVMGMRPSMTLFCAECRLAEEEWLKSNERKINWNGLVDFESIQRLVDRARETGQY